MRVELVGPLATSGRGVPRAPPTASRGPALDFCLLVTQRRHRDDVELDVEGAGGRRVDRPSPRRSPARPATAAAPGQFRESADRVSSDADPRLDGQAVDDGEDLGRGEAVRRAELGQPGADPLAEGLELARRRRRASSTRTGSRGPRAQRACGRRTPTRPRRGWARRPPTATARTGGAAGARARGRSAGRGRRRWRRRRANRRGDGRGAGGSASTGSWPSTTSGRSSRMTRATSPAVVAIVLPGRRRPDRGSATSPARSPAKPAGRLALLDRGGAATRAGEVGGRVPRALRTVRADEVVDDASGGGPLGERAAGAELDVVGVGADGQTPTTGTARSRGQPPMRPTVSDGLARIVRSHAGRIGSTVGWARSSGLSTSMASRGSAPHLDAAARRPSPARGGG